MPRVEVVHHAVHQLAVTQPARQRRQAQRRHQHAVHRDVGVAPDGRGEVGVEGRGQAVVVVLRHRGLACTEARPTEAAAAPQGSGVSLWIWLQTSSSSFLPPTKETHVKTSAPPQEIARSPLDR